MEPSKEAIKNAIFVYYGTYRTPTAEFCMAQALRTAYAIDVIPLEQQNQELQTKLDAANLYIQYIANGKGCEGFKTDEEGHVIPSKD